MLLDKLADPMPLTRELCALNTGVVAKDNEPLFARLQREIALRLLRFRSGETHNGWVVPPGWSVEKALLRRNGQVVFDGTRHPLAVGMLSRTFVGEIDLETLRRHVVTRPELPEAYSFHSIWQIRNWAADWVLTIPYRVFRTFEAGAYHLELITREEPGEMIVGVAEKPGRSDQVLLFNTNHCHPTQANDGFAAVALLVRLFQWLAAQDTYYTYRLVIGPEHLGSIFYLRDLERGQIERIVSAVFAEMPGTQDPLTIASTFLGGQAIDRAFRNVARHYSAGSRCVGWRQGCGNDETVWEAPGHEIPTVEITRARDPSLPYPEYHSSQDTPDLMDPARLVEFFEVLQRVVLVLESDAVLHRHFDGLVCLSHPRYGLYFERSDPTIEKGLTPDDEKWGHLLDSLFRYFDGSMSILEIAEKHDLPFFELQAYLQRFVAKGLISQVFRPVVRPPVSRPRPAP